VPCHLQHNSSSNADSESKCDTYCLTDCHPGRL
jgi:hypothetical protein